ncbi:hypothetical protein E4U55_004915 [Claviceps digitariae]|nr:hypothetical protein E4U55_004915 [Claviceps digitariae]
MEQAYTLGEITSRPTGKPAAEPAWDGIALYVRPISPLVVYKPTSTSSLSSKSRRTSYFRSPRHHPSIDQFSRTPYSDLSSCPSLTDSSTSASGSSSAGSHVADHHLGFRSEDSLLPLPLDPRVDYSFREADLYYHQPRIKTFGDAMGAKDQSHDQWQTQTHTHSHTHTHTLTLKGSLQRVTAQFTTRK